MSQKSNKLSPGGIRKLLEAEAESESLIVQIYNLTLTKTGKFLCNISDGEYSSRAYFNQEDYGIKKGMHELTQTATNSQSSV